ncbi:MAG: ClpXP protease specificity-enhancing factor SspB [Rhizobiaceae bacterium]|nr:ClpXP protease specificity-enhancing factor SspB [Rhizobiaceae bacterium]
MSEDLIRYDILTQDALRSMIAKLLDEVSRTGLPGEHHFYITFDTCAPNVRLSERMKEKYPEEMTIVVQHRFWDLEVKEKHFQIGLSFDEIPELLIVPYEAIKGFYDPSVKFGLQFEVQKPSNEVPDQGPALVKSDAPAAKKSKKKTKTSKKSGSKPQLFEEPSIDKSESDSPPDDETNSGDEEKDANSADVVSLDSFRKKK